MKGEKIYLKSPLRFEKGQYYRGETFIALYSVTGATGETKGHLISISHVFCTVRFQGLTPFNFLHMSLSAPSSPKLTAPAKSEQAYIAVKFSTIWRTNYVEFYITCYSP